MTVVQASNRWEGQRLMGMLALQEAERVGSDADAVKAVCLQWLNQLVAAGRLAKPLNDRAERGLIGDHIRSLWSSMMWARCGFPQVVPSEKLAASLMSTRVPRICVPHLEMPWDTWVVRLAPGQLWFRGHGVVEEGSDFSVAREDMAASEIWVFNDWVPGRYAVNGSGDAPHPGAGGKTVYVSLSGSTWAGGWRSVTEWDELAEDVPESAVDEDSRGGLEALCAAGRLVLGCVAELNGSGVTRGRTGSDSAPRREKRGIPKAWTFELRRDVNVDCREWVRTATRSHDKSERRLPSVQTLVRGHWKPKLSERLGRLVHVEPYWRGPEDAPIAVRSHVLDGAK